MAKLILIAITLLIFPAYCLAEASDTKTLLSTPLEPGEALIWYLDHSGWAIKTKEHFLVFDYWERVEKPDGAGLAEGYIDPDEIKDLPVIVFVSHDHADHYDPVILEWQQVVPDITYVFGWQLTPGGNTISCPYERTDFSIGSVEVGTVVHKFDHIPESAFLLRVDDLMLLHSGDHCHPDLTNEVFVSNTEYLAGKAPKLDLLFTPTWGCEFYYIEQLKPSVIFPMHDGGHERQYTNFALKAKVKKAGPAIGAARSRGHLFRYAGGDLTDLSH